MIRTQIQLTEDQLDRLKCLARQEELAVAAVVRQAVEEYLQRHHQSRSLERALACVGQFEADVDDAASNHDRYLVEAYGEFER